MLYSEFIEFYCKTLYNCTRARTRMVAFFNERNIRYPQNTYALRIRILNPFTIYYELIFFVSFDRFDDNLNHKTISHRVLSVDLYFPANDAILQYDSANEIRERWIRIRDRFVIWTEQHKTGNNWNFISETYTM